MMTPKRKPYWYATCCVVADAESITDMIEVSREIKLSTIRRHCNLLVLEAHLGYRNGMKLEDDYHVRYHRSRFRGQPCYYIVHSAIEYIFTPGGKH